MPVLNIRALPQKDTAKVQNALKKTCVAIAEIYGCEPSQVWATWDEIKPGMYVEGESTAEKQPESSHPPIVQLICFAGKEQELIEKLLSVTAKTLSTELGIPNNIFVSYHEAMPGRVIAGNGIVRR